MKNNEQERAAAELVDATRKLEAQAPVRKSDYASVSSRRNALVGRRAVLLTTALVILGFVSVPVASWIGTLSRQDLPPVSASEVDGDRVGFLLYRGAVDLELLDPTDKAITIEDLQMTGEGTWTAMVTLRDCRKVLGTCSQLREGTLELKLDGSDLVVTKVSSDFPDDTRQQLQGHRVSSERLPDERGWQILAPVVAEGKIYAFQAWYGETPSVRGSTCVFQVVKSGTEESIWKGEPQELPGETMSPFALGMIVISPDSAISSGEVVSDCTLWRGQGWTMRSISEPVDFGAGTAVSFDVEWIGPPFGQAYTECTIDLFSPGGDHLGSRSVYLSGHATLRGQTTSERQVLFEKLHGVALTADGRCALMNPDDYARL